VPEDPADGPEADGHEEAQAAVDQLAARLDMSVLVEDRRQRPVWWATRGPVDATRVRTILNRRVDPPVARVVKTFDLANAVGPVRVPSMPELDMWARWCVPLRAEGELLGLLWVLDPRRPGELRWAARDRRMCGPGRRCAGPRRGIAPRRRAAA
jgi:hypothetical protein